MMRLNGRRVAGLRFNGRNVTARLNGKAAFSTGVRSIVKVFTDLNGWRQSADPARNPTLARLLVTPPRLAGGMPPNAFDGKAAASVYTLTEMDNEVGTWEVETHTHNPRAGLHTGIILGCDANASRMVAVEWESNRLVFRYRTSRTNNWVNIGINSSFRYSPSDTIRVTRAREGASYRVNVYQNDVRRSSWVDSTGIPGAKGTRFVGVRLEGERNLFTTGSSPSVTKFTFSAG